MNDTQLAALEAAEYNETDLSIWWFEVEKR
jgi:hypothetical protein